MIGYIKEIEVALLIIFNAGMITRTIKEIIDSRDDEASPSVLKIIGKNVKIAIVVNLSGAMIAIFKRYYW